MMLCTPSPRRKPFGSHLRKTSTPTPSEHPLPSSSQDPQMLSPARYLVLHSPFKSPLASTPRRLPAQEEDDTSSDSDPFSSDTNKHDDSDDEDMQNDNDELDAGIFSVPRNPKTPATARTKVMAKTDPRGRHRPNRNPPLSTTPLAAAPFAPPIFNFPSAPVEFPPKTPAVTVRTFAEDECLTRLSIHDSLKSEDGVKGKGRERKRTESTGSYMPARHRKTNSPPNTLGSAASPTDSIFDTNYVLAPPPAAPRPRLSKPAKKLTQSFDIGGFKASPGLRVFPSLQFGDVPASSLSPLDTSTFVHDIDIRGPLPHLVPSGPLPSDTSNTSISTSFSFDDVKPPQDVFKPHRLIRKFKPKDSGIAGIGTDDSDGGLGDLSFAGNASFSPVEPSFDHSAQDTITKGPTQPVFNLETPSIGPTDGSGWPTEILWGQGITSRPFNPSLDAEELMRHMARTAQNGQQNDAKPVMPDTPMKKGPARLRNWQSAVKLSTHETDYATMRNAPRKSLPLHLPKFEQECPDSPDSDPSPSKSFHQGSGSTLSKPPLMPRRKSYGMVGIGRPDGEEPPVLSVSFATSPDYKTSPDPLPALPMLGRAELLRRSSSGAYSAISEMSNESGSQGTPTKRGGPWKSSQRRVTDENLLSPTHPDTPTHHVSFGRLSLPARPAVVPMTASKSNPLPRRSLGTAPLKGLQLSRTPMIHDSTNLVHPGPVPPTPGSGPFSMNPGPVKAVMLSRPSLPGLGLVSSVRTHRPSLGPRRDSHPDPRIPSPSFGPSPLPALKSRAPALFAGSSTPARMSRKSAKLDLRSEVGNRSLAVPGAFNKRKSASRTRAETLGVPLGGMDDAEYRRKARARSRSLTPDFGRGPGEVLVVERPGRFEYDFIRPEGGGMLGKGTFGQVFKVTMKEESMLGLGLGSLGKDELSEQVFAVKKSKPYEGNGHRNRLLEEVDVLRHLTQTTSSPLSPTSPTFVLGHPNVLHFVDAWEEDRTLYLQTEICELGNLSDFLFEYGKAFDRLDESRLWKIASEISNGLQHIHSSGVIHLDLKPANIFVTGEGKLRIGDFGMATRWPRSNSTNAASGFEREGDREYIAAEILQGTYGPEADIFSFGMIMLEAAGNIVVPTNGDPWHRLRSDDFSEVNLEGFTYTLVSFIARMMKRDPALRPTVQDIQESSMIVKTRAAMKRNLDEVLAKGGKPFRASAFATELPSFMDEVLGPFERRNVVKAPFASNNQMDLS